MREFRDLDTTAMKAFYHAATTQNFTEAAQRAHMTQSGVSQHIAKLESHPWLGAFFTRWPPRTAE